MAGALLILAVSLITVSPQSAVAGVLPFCRAMSVPTPISGVPDAFLHGTLCVPPELTQNIRVPVLGVIGQLDSVFCGVSSDCVDSATFLARENGFYSPEADFQAYVLPGAGHVVNLMSNTALYQQAVASWLARTFG